MLSGHGDGTTPRPAVALTQRSRTRASPGPAEAEHARVPGRQGRVGNSLLVVPASAAEDRRRHRLVAVWLSRLGRRSVYPGLLGGFCRRAAHASHRAAKQVPATEPASSRLAPEALHRQPTELTPRRVGIVATHLAAPLRIFRGIAPGYILDCEQDHTRGYKREVMTCLEEDPQRLRRAIPGGRAGRVLRRLRAGSRRVRAPPISPSGSASRPTASGTSWPSTVGIDVGREDEGEEMLSRSTGLPADRGGRTFRRAGTGISGVNVCVMPFSGSTLHLWNDVRHGPAARAVGGVSGMTLAEVASCGVLPCSSP